MADKAIPKIESTSSSLKILYVASEVYPFLKTERVSEMLRRVPQVMQERGMEIRILAPRFGLINEKKNRLHKVVRLSGTHISIGDDEKPLEIKVASLPHARLQVYFIDNEDYFERKHIFHDAKNNFYSDNDERVIFFCRGALETVRKLGWRPDVIHCSDWMTSLIPLYVKTAYRDDPLFSGVKCVFTVHEDPIEFQFSDDILDKIKTLDMDDKMLSPLREKDYTSFIRLGMAYSDAVIGARAAALCGDGYEEEVRHIDVSEDGKAEDFSEIHYNLYNELVG